MEATNGAVAKVENLRILIADSDERFVELLTERLKRPEKFNSVVESCANGSELFARIYKQTYDLIFMDTDLPGLDGLEILKRLGQTTLPLPIIMMTHKENVRIAVEAMKRGVLDYIMKDDLKKVDLGRVVPRLISSFRLRQENEELKHINQMKDDFLATISHELRTPLTSILGLCEVLLTGRLGALQDTQANSLRKILGQSHNLIRLINQLLDIRTLMQNDGNMEMTRISFGEIVQRCTDAVKAGFEKKGVTLSLKFDHDPLVIEGHGENLGKVVEHIMTNALKFTPAGGTVTVETRKMDTGHIQFRVSDTGQGIPAESLPHVFQKFFHVDQTLTRPYGGMGLGLAFCKEVVESHGGRIWVESKGVGQGAVVNTILPKPQESLLRQTMRTGAEAQVIEEALKEKTILWVDDNPSLLELVGYSFAGSSFPVRLVTAANGQETLDKVDKEHPDLLVVDVMMPGMDGLELIDRLRQHPVSKSIPILVVTGYQGAARAALARGANDICIKPFRIQDLLLKLERLLLSNQGG